MAIINESKRYENYKAPLLAIVTVASLAFAIFQDSLGLPVISFPHVFYVPGVLAGILYGRRSAPLMAALGVIQSLLIYLDTNGMVLAAAIDGTVLFLLAYVMGTLSDLRGQLNQQLAESGARMARIIDSYPDATVIVDNAGKVIAWNLAMERLTGLKASDIIGRGSREYANAVFGEGHPVLIDLVGRPEEEVAARFPGARVSDSRLESPAISVMLNGKCLVLHGTASPLYDGGGRMVGAIESLRDVTGQREMEVELQARWKELRAANEELALRNQELGHLYRQLQVSESRFRVLAESTASAIVILQDNVVKYANPAVEKITGYSREELLAMSPLEASSIIDPVSVLKLNLVQFRRKRSDGYRRYEIKLKTKDGLKKWVDVTTGVIDYNGRPAYLATGFDITERKEAEDRLRSSLHEKEVLLKEIHHRVKNNLQVVSSMLNLQATNIRDPGVAGIFRESQDRVRSMALIHEKLYRSGDLSRINFGEYVKNLTAFLVRSYNVRGKPVGLEIDVSDILLSVDLAIPCGLIINELVTNSLKYAFPDGRTGTIKVAIRKEGREYTLVVSDDGVGMPRHVDYRNHTSLGLQLVNTLVAQLEGDIALSTERGTVFTIRFSAG